MKRFLPLLVPLLLCSCSSNSNARPVPTPPPVEGPTLPAARPPRRVFVADWTGPDIKCAFAINGDVPPIDTIPADSDAIWGTLPDPACTDLTRPGPNALYTADGKLRLVSHGGGFAIISRQTFSREGVISSQAELTCVQLFGKDAWGGLVGQYNGDAKQPMPPTLEEQMKRMWETGEWRGGYFDERNGQLYYGYWGPGTDNNAAIPVQFNVPYIARTDYDHSKGGQWTHWLMNAAGEVLYHVVEDPAAPKTKDTMLLGADPRFAIFLGDMELIVGPADVCAEVEK